MEFIDGLKWRYATKKFDPNKKVSSQDLEILKEAVQLSASSYGLQLYKILVIEDSEVRTNLKKAAYDQSQVTDSSHIFLFCNYTDVQDDHVDKYLNLTSQIRQQDISELQSHGNGMKKSIKGLSEEALKVWTGKQVYIALGTLLTVAAEMRIDTCPMEGFKAEEFNKILGLKEKGLNAAVMATIGYRSENDKYQHKAKVRKPLNELYEII